MRAGFRYAALFLWILLPAAAYGVYATKGLPHLIVSYRFLDNGARYDPFAERWYTDCTFWGPYGQITVGAKQGRCGWVRFFKEPN